MSYLHKTAYPNAKAILQSRRKFQKGIDLLLEQCQKDLPCDLWSVIAYLNFERELEHFLDWWPSTRQQQFPSNETEVLFLGLHDVPTAFNLRGSSSWSKDPEDWDWFSNDDYDGPTFESRIMQITFGLAEQHDDSDASPFKKTPKNKPSDAREVVEMFFSMTFFGLMMREAIGRLSPGRFLGRRKNRWFVIGHPDAVYGIILGQLTKSGWRTFKG